MDEDPPPAPLSDEEILLQYQERHGLTEGLSEKKQDRVSDFLRAWIAHGSQFYENKHEQIFALQRIRNFL